MDKKKIKELIQQVIRNNVDNLSFGDDKHNAPLRKANGLLHEVLIELEKTDWVSVKEYLPKYGELVDVCMAEFSGKIVYGMSKRIDDKHIEHTSIRDYSDFVIPDRSKVVCYWKPVEKIE